MISKQEDYKYAIPECEDIDYTLDIMPQRDVNRDGSWKFLYGVDVAFLLEAAAERRIICEKPSNVWAVYPMTSNRVISGYTYGEPPAPGTIYQAFNALWQMRNLFIKRESVPTAEQITDESSFNNLTLTDTDLKMSVINGIAQEFFANKVLKADLVRACFWLASKLRVIKINTENNFPATTFQNVGFTYSASGEYKQVTTLGNGHQSVTSHGYTVDPVGLFNYYHHVGKSYLGGTGSSVSTIATMDTGKQELAAGNITVTALCLTENNIPLDIKRSGVSVYCKVNVRNTITTHNDNVVSGGTYFQRVNNVTITSDNVITLDISKLQSIVTSALDRYNANIDSDPTLESIGNDTYYYHYVTVEVESVIAFLELGDHTDISHIGWTWEPGDEAVET